MGILRFQLLGVPTEIHAGFWLLPLYLGLREGAGVPGVALWVAVVFVSLCVHELGHAALARTFGQTPAIALHMLGGTTRWTPTGDIGRLRHIFVSLAGPFAGFALGLVGLLVFFAIVSGGQSAAGFDAKELTPMQTLLTAASMEGVTLGKGLALLVWVNFFWGIVNLMPVLPFDGGQVLASALGPARRKLAARASFGFALVVALWLFSAGSLLGAVIFFSGGLSSLLAAERESSSGPKPEALLGALKRAQQNLAEGQLEQAAAIARAVYEGAREPDIKRLAIEVIAWAALMSGAATSARAALERLPRGERVDGFLESSVLEAEGKHADAAEVLAELRRRGDTRLEVTALWVRVLLAVGNFEKAARVTIDIFESTESDEARRVAAEAFEGGASLAAAMLFMKAFERDGEPQDAYDAARGFARAGDVDLALAALDRAVSAGHDPEQARADEDLRTVSSDDRFEKALAGVLATGAATDGGST